MPRLTRLILLCCSAIYSPWVSAELLPSETTTLMVRALQQNPISERTSITRPIMARMRTDDLEAYENFLKGEAHFINFEPEPARDSFWAFRDRNDDLGRVASQRLMIIRINAFNMVDELVNQDIPAYRDRFETSPHDRFGISYPVMQTARALAEAGKPQEALDLVVDEVERHDEFDAPYFAYRLPDSFMKLADEHDRAKEFRALKRWVSDGIDQALERRLSEFPPPERRAFTLPGSMLGTLFEDQRRDYHEWTAEFLKLQAQLAQADAR